MALACLAVVEPLNPNTGRRRKIRLASAQDRRITGLGGKVWEPAMLGAPSLSLSLFNGDFTVPASVGGAQCKVAVETLRRGKTEINPVWWNGAPISIYAAEPGTMWPWPLIFTPASELATAMPRSLWQCTDQMALSLLGTRSRRFLMNWPYSSGTA